MESDRRSPRRLNIPAAPSWTREFANSSDTGVAFWTIVTFSLLQEIFTQMLSFPLLNHWNHPVMPVAVWFQVTRST